MAPAPLVAERRSGSIVVVVAAIGLLALVVAGDAVPALAVALAAAVAWAVAARPQRGVLLLVAFLPFDGLRAILGAPDWGGSWKEVLVGFTLACTFLAAPAARGQPGRRYPGWTLALVAWAAVAAATALPVHDVQALIGLKIDFFYVLAALAVWRCPLDHTERDRLVTILMVDGLICAAYGVVQQILGGTALLKMGYELDTNVSFIGSYLRAFSTFVQPSQFGFFMTVVLLMGIPAALAAPRRLRNRLFLLTLPVYGLGLLSGFVRGALLGLGVGLLYLGLRRYRVLLAVLPLLAVMVLVLGVLGNAATGVFRDPTSLGQRTTSWDENFVQIADHPFGAGVGRSGAASEKAVELKVAGASFQPDNYYFKTAFELGVIGLWVFALFLFAAWRGTDVGGRRAPPDDAPFLFGVAAVVLAGIAASFVATYFEIYPMDALLWVLLGVAAATAAGGASEAAATPMVSILTASNGEQPAAR